MNFNRLKVFFSDLWPHLLVLVGFAVVSLVYFSPVLNGKVLRQSDNIHATGAMHELVQYEQQTGEKAQWTDSMFGGMPAYQIKSDSSKNIFHSLCHWIRFGLPYTTVAIVFLYLVGFYVLLVSLDMSKWLAVAGALAFGLGSYNIIIIVAGHITKCYAIAMMPLVVGGVIMTFSGRRVLGGIFTMVSLGLELAYNHVQITYYLALALVVLAIFELVSAIRSHTLAQFGKSVAVLAAAVVMSVLPSVTNLWTTYEYGAFSIRGASELKATDGKAADTGLDKDYALSWSYGVHETPTLLVPNVVGGASKAIGMDNKAVRGLAPNIAQAVAQQSAYWGGRAFTSGPVYLGAIVCFLFFIGCFYYDGRHRWWLIVATVLSLFLAWGKNFPIFTDLMFDYFPLYNKFRTVEMALVIASVTVPLLAMLGLKAVVDYPEDVRNHPGKFFIALGLTGGVALLLFVCPTLFYSFLSPEESEQLAKLALENPIYGTLRQGLIDARAELTSADALRSAVFIMLGSSALWFYSVRKINANIMVASIALLTAIDLWGVDRRYLSASDFVSKSESRDFALSTADKAILADKTPHRVMSLYANPFNEVFTSYYHHSVGGYHGAKLRRYQDVIDRYLAPEWNALRGALGAQDYEGIDKALADAPALNMLSTKYLIYNPDRNPIVNPYALPRAWFVSRVSQALSPDDALDFVGHADLANEAVIECASLPSVGADSLATVVQTSYKPDAITYETHSNADGLVVFSEIFYPAGWVATIDGQEAEILRADYVLRALTVPAGRHKVEFSFRPVSYSVGNVISLVASVAVVLIVLGAFAYMLFRKPVQKGVA